MDLGALIAEWGYPAVLVGTVLEGETVLLLAGFAAHRGHLALSAVIGCAVAGSVLGDQIAFLAGRRWGVAVANAHPRLRAMVAQALPRLQRNATWFVLINRFLYGLRVAGPFAVGMTSMPWLRFLALNLVGATFWATIIAVIGYALGEGVQRALGHLRLAEEVLFGAVLIGAIAMALVRHWRASRAAAVRRPD
jgi:membrane protein DedA with SNARE-associated domain